MGIDELFLEHPILLNDPFLSLSPRWLIPGINGAQLNWLVVSTPLKNNYQSVGMVIPNIWKYKKCSKPPTSKCFEPISKWDDSPRNLLERLECWRWKPQIKLASSRTETARDIVEMESHNWLACSLAHPMSRGYSQIDKVKRRQNDGLHMGPFIPKTHRQSINNRWVQWYYQSHKGHFWYYVTLALYMGRSSTIN